MNKIKKKKYVPLELKTVIMEKEDIVTVSVPEAGKNWMWLDHDDNIWG